MAANLKARLSRIREAQARESRAQEAQTSEAPQSAEGAGKKSPDFLAGWQRAEKLVWTRRLVFPSPLPPCIDSLPFAALGSRSRPRQDNAENGNLPSGKLRLFDLETTGLSGGAGTLAFLASVGSQREDGSLAIDQVFLEDFPGEGAFLGIVLSLLGNEEIVASYNGASFDLPLLRSRCILNGIPCRNFRQLDALFVSRRLWRSVLGDASLGSVEKKILGMDRGPDIDSSRIPEVWLGYVGGRDREAENPESKAELALILSHNASDILALAAVLARVSAIYQLPLQHLHDGNLDRRGCARGLLALGRIEEGESLLASAAGDGDEKAALLLFHRLRLARRQHEALGLMDRLPPSFQAETELAKYFERLAGNLREAEIHAQLALERAQYEEARAKARSRLDRIRDRLRKAGAPG